MGLVMAIALSLALFPVGTLLLIVGAFFVLAGVQAAIEILFAGVMLEVRTWRRFRAW